MARRIEINIDELVLDGFAPGDRHNIGESLQLELRRLITEQSIPGQLSRDWHVEWLDAGEFSNPVNSKPESTGNQIAKSVYKRLII
jgi:hypothetical protein